MSRPVNVIFSVPSEGFVRVQAEYHPTYGPIEEVDHTVEADGEIDAYEKVFGRGSYGYHLKKEDPDRDDPYLQFLRST